MIEGIAPLYEQIAESIRGSITEEWTSAWIDAVFYPDHIFYSGEYVAADHTSPKSFATDMDSERAFRRIRELFKQAGKSPWCRARFELSAPSKFKMSFSYDNCDKDGFAHPDAESEPSNSPIVDG